jgi:hypothetical protein
VLLFANRRCPGTHAPDAPPKRAHDRRPEGTSPLCPRIRRRRERRNRGLGAGRARHAVLRTVDRPRAGKSSASRGPGEPGGASSVRGRMAAPSAASIEGRDEGDAQRRGNEALNAAARGDAPTAVAEGGSGGPRARTPPPRTPRNAHHAAPAPAPIRGTLPSTPGGTVRSGGGGNRTRVLERPSGASTSVACGGSRLGAPTGGGPSGQPGFVVRRRPPGGATSVSLRTTPVPGCRPSGAGGYLLIRQRARSCLRRLC